MCWAKIIGWFKKPVETPSEDDITQQTIDNEEHLTPEQQDDENPKGEPVQITVKFPGYKTETFTLSCKEDNALCLEKLPDNIVELTITREGMEPKTVWVNCNQEGAEICLSQQSVVCGSTLQKKKIVLLDNGHAASTPGKRSPKFDDGSQFFEYEFNRDIVKRLTVLLDKAGIEYEVLVPEIENDIKLTERANRANKLCKEYGKDNCLLISVHANAFGMGDKWEKPVGWEVWTCKGHSKSDDIAKMFWEEAKKELDNHNKVTRDGKVQGNGNPGPGYESNFTILAKSACPAILTENMFYTNKEEAEWLMSDIGRDVITLIHFNGIKRWLESE